MILAVSSAAAPLRSTQNTCAPSRAKVTAVALPLPQPGPIEPAPTTIATLPLSRSILFSLFFLLTRIAAAQRRAQADVWHWNKSALRPASRQARPELRPWRAPSRTQPRLSRHDRFPPHPASA